MPVLPGIAYYWGDTTAKAPEEGKEPLTLLKMTTSRRWKYRTPPDSHGGIGLVEWDVDPAKGGY